MLVAMGAQSPGFAGGVHQGQPVAAHCDTVDPASASDEHDDQRAGHHDADGQMSAACMVVCLGSPAPGLVAHSLGARALPRGLAWRVAAEFWQGRPVAPVERPPNAI